MVKIYIKGFSYTGTLLNAFRTVYKRTSLIINLNSNYSTNTYKSSNKDYDYYKKNHPCYYKTYNFCNGNNNKDNNNNNNNNNKNNNNNNNENDSIIDKIIYCCRCIIIFSIKFILTGIIIVIILLAFFLIYNTISKYF